jgi:hypothetical protein
MDDTTAREIDQFLSEAKQYAAEHPKTVNRQAHPVTGGAATCLKFNGDAYTANLYLPEEDGEQYPAQLWIREPDGRYTSHLAVTLEEEGIGDVYRDDSPNSDLPTSWVFQEGETASVDVVRSVWAALAEDGATL